VFSSILRTASIFLTILPQRGTFELWTPHSGIHSDTIGNIEGDAMIRLIKRYGSRKLYDTEESRYVSLDELAGWIRQGQEIRVIDNRSSDDVTSHTLTQIISEEGRRGTTLLPNELLHELIRIGEQAVSSGVEQLQTKMDRLVQASIDRIGPVRRAREEMGRLRERLENLEDSLAAIEHDRVPDEPESSDDPEEKPE
jgi:polyhydroxyalkanoate synthesis repressor PhaR